MISPPGLRYPVSPDVERFLGSFEEAALARLVLELATYSPEAMRSLELRAAAPDDSPGTVRQLVSSVDAALDGVDLDHHDPFYDAEVDDSVEEVLDELGGTSRAARAL